MKLHEFQAKEVLAKYGIPVPRGRVARTPDEAATIARELGETVVVKAQAHTGGRGKGGGVKLANSADEARHVAGEILGMQLVTHQTGPAGLPVHSVLVEEQIDIARELYLSVAIDMRRRRDLEIPDGSLNDYNRMESGAFNSIAYDKFMGGHFFDSLLKPLLEQNPALSMEDFRRPVRDVFDGAFPEHERYLPRTVHYFSEDRDRFGKPLYQDTGRAPQWRP